MGRIIVSLAVVCLLLTATQVLAVSNWSDGFESYNLGALDKNLSGGPNAAPNGSGNPWWGPGPPNARVVGTTNGVAPHENQHMVQGLGGTAADFDQDWLNIAYRLNSGAAIPGNIKLHWWFYDQVGANNGKNCQDYVALEFYGGNVPPNADAAAGYPSPTGITQRMSLGMTSNTSAGVDYTKYQARVVGDTGGYANGWYNLNIGRSIGWHEAQIVVGAALADNSNTCSFYIDDMVNPLLVKNSVTKNGYNLLEMNLQDSVTTAFFDDMSITVIPEPGSLLALGTGLIGMLGLIRRRR